MVKLTFSVDEETARTLRSTAERLRKPQRLIVREAVAEYAARAGCLGRKRAAEDAEGSLARPQHSIPALRK